MKRIQLLKEGKKVGQSGSVISGRRKTPLDSCTRYLLKKLVWKVKSECRKALKWQRSSTQFSYNFHNYSLNFDDGVSSMRTSTISC